jgi:hypothetical protein
MVRGHFCLALTEVRNLPLDTFLHTPHNAHMLLARTTNKTYSTHASGVLRVPIIAQNPQAQRAALSRLYASGVLHVSIMVQNSLAQHEVLSRLRGFGMTSPGL